MINKKLYFVFYYDLCDEKGQKIKKNNILPQKLFEITYL